MSELAEEAQPSTEEVREEVVQQEANDNQDKPAGYDPVDTDDPRVKERIDYLYKQVKQNQNDKREYQRLAAEQYKVIEQMQQNLGGVVNHIQEKSFADTEAQINYQLKSAYETGDSNSIVELQNRLFELKLQKQQAPKNTKQQAPTPTDEYKPYNSSYEIAQDAYNGGEITQQELNVVQAWQSETSDTGQPIRPWATDKDPRYGRALKEMNVVFTEPEFATFTFDQKLEELDKRMGTRKSKGGQTVMGGHLTFNSKPAKVTLSKEAREIAVRTRFAGPKATEAEHLEAYRKQLEKVKRSSK